MSAAGDYSTRLEWYKKRSADVDEFGERQENYWPSQGCLWGAVGDLVAGRTIELDSERQETRAVIRLRNYPAVSPGDRLRELGSGVEWTVETVLDGDNEVICEVIR